MKYLNSQQILLIHDQVIKRFGGSFGLRDQGLLETAVARREASYGGEDLYPTIFDKGAALLQSLHKNHPFVDGNKRTALSSTGIFLKMNGIRLINTHDQEVEFAVSVDTENLNIEKIAKWLENNSERV